jgi:hypothetical protein
MVRKTSNLKNDTVSLCASCAVANNPAPGPASSDRAASASALMYAACATLLLAENHFSAH